MRYYRVLIFSLVIHVILALLVSQYKPAPIPHVQPQSYVELTEKPELAKRPHQLPKDEKQFVRQVQVPDQLKTKEKRDARFASEDEQYVLQEQKARMNDMTTNRSMSGQKNAKPEQQADNRKVGKRGKVALQNLDIHPESPMEQGKQRMLKGLDKPPATGDVAVGGMAPRPQRQAAGQNGEDGRPMAPSFGGIERGQSTLGEQLPNDVKFGDFTALNTDRHLYYSFYARMEEKIRFRWITYARAAIFSVPQATIKNMGKDVFVTQLEILLDPKGHYVRSILYSGSGLTTLDDAPAQAFKDAADFPNAPPEMVKSDGFIHIYYAFSVNMGPASFAGN